MIEKDKKVKLGEVLVEFCCKNKDDGKLPVYSVTNNEGFVLSTDYFSKEVFSKNLKTYKIVDNGDFAYNPSRINVGSIDYYKGEGKALISPLYVTFKVKSDIIDRRYLKYFLKSSYGLSEIRRNTSGSVRDTLSFGQLARISINLPSIAKQKLIVKELEKVSLLIEKRKESITLLDKYLESIFSDMFGDPISNPKKWPTKTIEEIVKKEKYSIKRGPFGGSLKKDVFVEEGYLVYEQFHALNRDFSFARYYIDEKKFQELKAFEVKAGDIIISCSGVYLGKLAEIPQDYKKGIINQALLKISLNNEIMRNKLFMDIFTNPSFKAKYLDNKIGSGIPNFPPVSVFKTFQFICPEMNIQKEYENKVKEVENLRNKMHEQVSELEQLMQSFNQKYFSN